MRWGTASGWWAASHSQAMFDRLARPSTYYSPVIITPGDPFFVPLSMGAPAISFALGPAKHHALCFASPDDQLVISTCKPLNRHSPLLQ